MSNNPSNFTHGHLNTAFIYGLEEGILQSIFLGIIAIFGILGNLYICSVIHRNKNLRNPTFIFLVNLAVANIGALTLCSPFALINSIRRRFTMQQHWCLLNGFLNNLFFCISIFTLFLIAIQNYFSIVRQPSCEWLKITKKRAKFHLLGLWCLCFAFSLLSLGPFENWSYMVFNPTTAHCGIAFPETFSDKMRLLLLALMAFIIPLCSMSFVYCRIYLKVSSHEGRVNQNAERRASNQISAVSRKLAVTLCLMFSTFLICWLPFFILIALAVISNDASNLPRFLGRIAYWSGYLNCAINPSLYCLRSSSFKDVIRRRSASTSGEVTIRQFVRRQRALSLPAMSVTFKRPVLKRLERQSYPNAAQGGSTQDLPISAELHMARLRAYSCSTYEITEKPQITQGSEEMYQGRKISKGGDKFTGGISGSWHVYETENIHDLSGCQQLAETSSRPNTNKDDITTSI